MCQNCLHGSGSWLQWAGNLCRMKLRNCWYSRSSSVCFRMSCSRRLLVVPPCRVLISVSVIYEWPLVSISASVSAFSESNSGLRESASEASFFLPFIHSAVKMYAISLVLNLCKHGFSISSRWWLLMIGISGLWSVMTEKCCKPAKKVALHYSPTYSQHL